MDITAVDVLFVPQRCSQVVAVVYCVVLNNYKGVLIMCEL